MTAHLDIYDKLLTAGSQEQIFNFFNRQCLQLGYTSYLYSPLTDRRGVENLFREDSEIVKGNELARQEVFTTYPLSWVQRYQEARYIRSDPVLKLIAASNLPVFWDDARHYKHVVFDEARQHGLANGITVPVCGPTGERAVLSIATDIAPEKSPQHRMATAGAVLLTAIHLHEAIQRTAAGANEPPVPRLTPREKECLRWAAQGKTSWEIGNILSISEWTVVFHITKATRKLNATNRRQAIARALSLRLIHP
jgi:DNA-binding CsgD family transcriptional regulator